MFPAVCALALALLAAAQLALTAPDEIADPGFGGGGVRIAMPALPAPHVDPVLLAAPLFSPARTMGATAGEGGSQPAWRLTGSIAVRGRTIAIMQDGSGRIVRLAPGRSIDGMRLSSVNDTGATFIVAGKRVAMNFGSGFAPQSAGGSGDGEE